MKLAVIGWTVLVLATICVVAGVYFMVVDFYLSNWVSLTWQGICTLLTIHMMYNLYKTLKKKKELDIAWDKLKAEHSKEF